MSEWERILRADLKQFLEAAETLKQIHDYCKARRNSPSASIYMRAIEDIAKQGLAWNRSDESPNGRKGK